MSGRGANPARVILDLQMIAAKKLAVIGLDVGTSALKAVAVTADGGVVAQADAAYPLLTPRPGWSEQSPHEWWRAATETLSAVTAALDGSHEVAAVGLSGQMHGMVPLDAAGEVVRPAILWNDQRTEAQVALIEAAVPRAELIRRTGNPAITGFQLPKVLWLKRHEPEQFARTRSVLFPKDYVGYRLTGRQYAEPTDASGSNAFDLHAKAWDDGVLRAVALDPGLWPQVVPSGAVVGAVTPDAARATGLPVGLPVVAGAGDNAGAAWGMGLGARRRELGSVSLGTSGVIFAALDTPNSDPDGRVHLFCHADGGYHLLGVTLAAAGSLSWFRNAFMPQAGFEEIVALAATAPVGAGGVTFKPYLSGERTPHLDPNLRASFHGLSLATGPEHLARAVLEGVAFSLRDALDVMAPLTRLERALLTGGGAASALWSQIVCDVLQIPLGVSESGAGPALGAARLALQSQGADFRELAAHGAEIDWLEPGGFEAYGELLGRYRSLG